jgi:hypothetical protein
MEQHPLIVDSWVLKPDRLCIFGTDKGFHVIASREAVSDIWKGKIILYDHVGLNVGWYCPPPEVPDPPELPQKTIPLWKGSQRGTC